MIIIAFLLPFSLLLFLVNSLHLHSCGLFCFQISLSSHWAGGVSEQLHGAELPARLNHNTRFCSGAYHTEKLFLKNCALHFCVGRPREWVIANIPLYFCIMMGLGQDFIRVMQIRCLNTGIYVCWLDKIFLVFSYISILLLCFTCRPPWLGPLNLRLSYCVAFPHHFSMLPYHVHFLYQCQYPITDRRALTDSWRAIHQWLLYVMHCRQWSKSSTHDRY